MSRLRETDPSGASRAAVPAPAPAPAAPPSAAAEARARRRVGWIALALTVIYCGRLAGPYLQSIVVRDAAVTSWLHVATAPTAGRLGEKFLRPGELVPAEGELVTLVNPLADRTPLEHALAAVASAEARVAQLNQNLAAHRELLANYFAAFKQDLDVRLENQAARLAFVRVRLETEEADAARFAQLLGVGAESKTAAAAAQARVAALQSERSALEETIERGKLRRAAADRGVRLLDDGSESAWEIQVEVRREEKELVSAVAELAGARSIATAARDLYQEQHHVALRAPAGSLVWHRYASPGATVAAGAPVVSWLDPSVLLIDVPLSDAEAALLRPGMEANAIFEGERRSRAGKVLFVRGSAGTLATQDLAAVAKARRPGHGHAIVEIAAQPEDRLNCPVGRTAHVDFPDVSIFGILRVRLRL